MSFQVILHTVRLHPSCKEHEPIHTIYYLPRDDHFQLYKAFVEEVQADGIWAHVEFSPILLNHQREGE